MTAALRAWWPLHENKCPIVFGCLSFTQDTTAPSRPQVVFVLDDAIIGDPPRAPPLAVLFDVVATTIDRVCQRFSLSQSSPPICPRRSCASVSIVFHVFLIRRRLDVARRRSRYFPSSMACFLAIIQFRFHFLSPS